MGFFDKLSDIVSSTGKELNKKAKDLVSTSKLEGQISAEEEKIHNAFLQIGMDYYHAHKDTPDAFCGQLCEQIAASYDTIEQLKKEVERLKGLQRCPNCGSAVTIEAAFCPSCGTKMPEVVEAAEEPAETAKEVVEEVVETVEEVVEEVAEKVEDVVEDVTDKKED